MTTLFIDWLPLDGGRWLARCDANPGWKWESEDAPPFPDREAAEKSLKSWHRKHLMIEHHHVEVQHYAAFNQQEDEVAMENEHA